MSGEVRLIDANALDKAIIEIPGHGYFIPATAIAQAHTIDTAPVAYSSWIPFVGGECEDINNTGTWACSVCGSQVNMPEAPLKAGMEFCYNCGARMTKEAHND
jgi:hypothetical protein